MKKIIIAFIILFHNLYSQSLDELLQDYEYTSKNSKKTINEKLGHVISFTQEDIQLYQYTKLSELLKEIPTTNTTVNRFGLNTLSLAGTKSLVSGFFKLFINDNEINSIQTQSSNLTWADIPLDFIDHVEIYYGEGSLSLGSEPGIYFIRLYTKDSKKVNGNQFKINIDKNHSTSNTIVHSQYLENDWSYLLFANSTISNSDTKYRNENISNDANNKYLFLDIKNDRNKINLGYTNITKDNYMGLSNDVVPDNGEIKSENFFINSTNYFLEDKSLKTFFSYDFQNRDYHEENAQGISVVPYINQFVTSFDEDLRFSKLNFNISKNFKTEKNNFLMGLTLSQKKYKTNNIKINDNSVGSYTDFNKENLYSISLQNDYKLLDDLLIVGNVKFDKYERNGYLDDSSEPSYRIGAIYTPIDNLGFKTFYTKTYLIPSFVNSDFSSILTNQIKTQKYKYFTIEGIYNYENSKFKAIYYYTKVDDFIYYLEAPVVGGFINIDHQIKTYGYTLYYDYNFNQDMKMQLNYFKIGLNDTINTPKEGGYAKFAHKVNDNYSYFTNLKYRGSSSYNTVKAHNSFDLDLGATYNYTKNLSFSFKAQNILNDAPKTLYFDMGNPVMIKNNDRNFNLSMTWKF